MPTIVDMADRLDMSAEEALTALKKLDYKVENVESEITDEQCDILMDVDEDPSTLDAMLAERQKKVEEEEKRAQQRLANLKKATEAKKKKAAAKKKKTSAKKKPAAAEKVVVAEIAPPEEDATNGQAPPAEIIPVVEVEEEAPAPAPEVEAKVEAEVEAQPVVEDEATPAAEILPPPPVEEPPAEEESKVVAEILPDIPVEEGESADPAAAKTEANAEDPDAGHMGKLAEAEKKHEDEERRRKEREKNQKEERPLPTPDPAVVAEVIRRAEEKKRLREQPRSRPAAAGGASTPGAATPARGGREALNRDLERTRGGGGGPPSPGGAGGRPGAGKKTGKTARKRQKRTERARALEDTMRRDAAAAVREFESGGLGGSKRRKKKKREDGEGGSDVFNTGGLIEVDDTMTVEQLSEAIGVPVADLILALMDEDIMATKNEVLSLELVRKLASQYNYEVQGAIPEEEALVAEEADAPEDLVLRAPVITVMGHVDHGKTSFLDAVRRENVAAGEAGGITQHIAAYDVETDAGHATFLDTPGHEAFTAMRARGSQVTDVVVLVVAADDGVKPQTIEAIDHARAAGVPIVVAVNKCDKPGAEPDRVRQELIQYQLVDENWGGDTVIRNISAQTGDGIPELLDMLVLVSEMKELKANPNKRARGAIIESELSVGQGVTAWMLVQTGTLRVGDSFICGHTYGRVRTMVDSRGESVTEAGPSKPVMITGFNEMPGAGDAFVCVVDERAARTVSDKRASLSKQKRAVSSRHMTLEDFHARMMGQDLKTLNIIVKADAQGSVDVLQSSFLKLGNEEVSISIVHSGVGGVNESDVVLASASDAVIIGFHVTAAPKIQKLAENEGVEIRTYRVIYEAIDEVKNALEGMLTPEKKEVITGHAEIREVFRSSALGNIAGCSQLDGESTRNSLARLTRDDVVVYEGKIESLRREKDDVKSVSTGYECGIKLENYNDIQAGDVIETYKIESIAKTLA